MTCLPLNNCPRNSESAKKPCGDGKSMEIYKQQKQQKDTEDICTMKRHSMPQADNQKASTSMQECHPTNSKVTLRDKFLCYKNNIPNTLCCQILAQESTSKENPSSTFWNSSSKEKSQKLWLPTGTDCLVSDMNSLTSSSNNMEQFSQSLITQRFLQNQNCHKTSYQSLQFSRQDTTVPENTVITKKHRILLNIEQKQLFWKCVHGHRYFYNKANEVMKNYLNDKDTKKCPSFIDIRKQIITPDKQLDDSNSWQKDIPYDTRQLAIKNVVTAYKAAFTNKRKGNIQHFNVQFLSKKQNKHYFNVDASAIDMRQCRIFKRRLKKKSKMRLRKRERKKINLENKVCDSVITHKNGKWYLCLVQQQKLQNIPEKPCNVVCLDPGVRTFQSYYSPDGFCGKIGDKYSNHLGKYYKHIDTLESAKTKVSKSTKRKIQKRCLSLRNKVRNIVSDLHNKSMNLLCNTFQTILLPEFQTQQMAKKEDRNIQNTTVRRMMSLRHYDFKSKLQDYGKRHKCQVHIVNESFTSKICGNCGTENQTLGSSAVFQCKNCSLCIDRDIHAARNICLKNCVF